MSYLPRKVIGIEVEVDWGLGCFLIFEFTSIDENLTTLTMHPKGHEKRRFKVGDFCLAIEDACKMTVGQLEPYKITG